MKKLVIALLFLITNPFLFAQSSVIADKGSYRKNFNEAIFNENDNEYDVALKYYQFAYKYDSSNANINFKIGFCYLNSGSAQKHLAERHLEKAIQNVTKNYSDDEPSEKAAPTEAYFYLGQAY